MSTINGVSIIEAPGFRPQPTIVTANDMTNGLGQTINTYVRTKYTLPYTWESLTDALFSSLTTALDPETYSTFSVTYPTLEGDSNTGTFRVTSALTAEGVARDSSGDFVWGNVTLTLEEV